MDWSRVSTCELLFLSVFISCFELFLLQYQDDVTNRACISQTLLIYCVSLSLCVLHSGGQSELSGSCTIGDALLLLSPSLSDFWCHSDFSSQTVIFPASVIHLMSFRTECLCGSPATIFVTLWFQHAKCQNPTCFFSVHLDSCKQSQN